jgi:hypothetical protein
MAMISSQGAPANDHQESATSVLDTGRRLDAKIGSSRSGSEIEPSLCGTLAQRFVRGITQGRLA